MKQQPHIEIVQGEVAPRPRDPVDLMMDGDFAEAIVAFEVIAQKSGDPLGICAAGVQFCKARTLPVIDAEFVVVEGRTVNAPVPVIRQCPECAAELQRLSGADGYAVDVVIVLSDTGRCLDMRTREKKRMDAVYACPRCEYATS